VGNLKKYKIPELQEFIQKYEKHFHVMRQKLFDGSQLLQTQKNEKNSLWEENEQYKLQIDNLKALIISETQKVQQRSASNQHEQTQQPYQTSQDFGNILSEVKNRLQAFKVEADGDAELEASN